MLEGLPRPLGSRGPSSRNLGAGQDTTAQSKESKWPGWWWRRQRQQRGEGGPQACLGQTHLPGKQRKSAGGITKRAALLCYFLKGLKEDIRFSPLVLCTSQQQAPGTQRPVLCSQRPLPPSPPS